MKKVLGMCVVGLLALSFAAQTAAALPAGEYKGKLFDYGSFFSGDTRQTATPMPVIYKDVSGVLHNVPVAGDWDRTVVKISQMFTPQPFTNEVYNGHPEIIGLTYDLNIGAVRYFDYSGNNDTAGNDVYAVQIDLVAGNSFDGYSGGRVDFWGSPAPALDNFNPQGDGAGLNGPWDWGAVADQAGAFDPWAAGNYDTFPTVTPPNAVPMFSGTFVSPTGGATLLTLTLYVDNAPAPSSYKAGEGVSSTGYIHILSNPAGWLWDYGKYLGGLAEIEFNNRFTFYPNTSISYALYDKPGDTVIGWDTASDDPVYFGLLPEPSSVALMGIGLFGLAGQLLRRRRRK